MKILSINIGKATTITYNGKSEQTGIFKMPIIGSITLDYEDVLGDIVVDRKYHGGKDKAVYMYGANHYAYWKTRYTTADYTYGAFGENITLENINEHKIFIGDMYQLGGATIQVTSSRIPCYKLGIRLGNPMAIKTFAEQSRSGVYFRVLSAGEVFKGDQMQLINKSTEKLSVAALHSLFSYQKNNIELAERAINHPDIADSFKNSIQKLINTQKIARGIS